MRIFLISSNWYLISFIFPRVGANSVHPFLHIYNDGIT